MHIDHLIVCYNPKSKAPFLLNNGHKLKVVSSVCGEQDVACQVTNREHNCFQSLSSPPPIPPNLTTHTHAYHPLPHPCSSELACDFRSRCAKFMLLCWMTKDSGSLQSRAVCSPFTVMGCGVEALSGLWWFQTRSGAYRSVFPGRGVPHTPLILTARCEAAVTRRIPLPRPPLHQMIASPVLRSLQICTCSRQTPQLSENEHFITEHSDQ